MIERYFEAADRQELKQGGVCDNGGGDFFLQCPCGNRTLMLAPGHGLSFSEDGTANTKASIGYRSKDGRPLTWCHWKIKNGKPVFYEDAKCPGAVEWGTNTAL